MLSRIITFSSFTEHTSPIFKSLKFVNIFDTVKLIISFFMYTLNKQLLPSVFLLEMSIIATPGWLPNPRLHCKLLAQTIEYLVLNSKARKLGILLMSHSNLVALHCSKGNSKISKSVNVDQLIALPYYIFLCVHACVCGVPSCPTDPINTPFNYITLN